MQPSATILEVVKSRPLDRTAALVTGKGEHWEPKIGNHKRPTSENPLPIRALMPDEKDFTGHLFGRFVVLGPWAGLKLPRQSVWVARCACGKYETFSRKQIESRNPTTDSCCKVCRHLENVKSAYRKRVGQQFLNGGEL